MSENVTESNVSVLKKAYRKAQYISMDFRRAEDSLKLAIDALKKADYNTAELELNLTEVQMFRKEARTSRKQLAAAYYAAVAEADKEEK